MFNLRKKKRPPPGGPDLAMLLAHLEKLSTGLAEQIFGITAFGEIDHDPARLRLASARMFDTISAWIRAELKAQYGPNTEALETIVTMGASHARLKFESKWQELLAAMPNVGDGAKN